MNGFMRMVNTACIVLAIPWSSGAPTTDWTVYLRRAGPVRIGMSVSQVKSVVGDPAARLVGNAPDVPLARCAYLESTGLPSGLSLMFANGRLVRIDVNERGIKTASGAEVGDAEEKIRRLYVDRISAEPHHYVPSGHYLRYTPQGAADRGHGMVFETDGAKVTSFWVGTLDAIALVEGCS